MTRQRIQLAIIVFAGITAVLLFLFRNPPKYSESVPKESFPEKPPVLEMPSASNVASSFAERIEQLKKSAAANPKNVPHLIALAQLLMDGHRNSEAIVYFEKAALLQPKNDSLLLDLSVCYFNEKNYEKALQITAKILSHDRFYTRALYNKGSILATMERKTEAIAVWKELLRHDPQSEEAKTVRGHISMLEKQ
ncbi:MAG: tetratricopeptide repeat protein [Bacteroidota bacterium]